MKKLLFVTIIGTAFMCALAFGDVKINKSHKGQETGGSKVNCAYCHTKNKIPKKGTNYAKYKKEAFCNVKGCHK